MSELKKKKSRSAIQNVVPVIWLCYQKASFLENVGSDGQHFHTNNVLFFLKKVGNWQLTTFSDIDLTNLKKKMENERKMVFFYRRNFSLLFLLLWLFFFMLNKLFQYLGNKKKRPLKWFLGFLVNNPTFILRTKINNIRKNPYRVFFCLLKISALLKYEGQKLYDDFYFLTSMNPILANFWFGRHG